MLMMLRGYIPMLMLVMLHGAEDEYWSTCIPRDCWQSPAAWWRPANASDDGRVAVWQHAALQEDIYQQISLWADSEQHWTRVLLRTCSQGRSVFTLCWVVLVMFTVWEWFISYTGASGVVSGRWFISHAVWHCRRSVQCCATWTRRLVVQCRWHVRRTWTRNLMISSRMLSQYVCLSVCRSVCLSVCMYVCTYVTLHTASSPSSLSSRDQYSSSPYRTASSASSPASSWSS